MISREQLSDLLRQVNAQTLAGEAGVNIKTIYRLRRGENSPRLELVERLIAACRRSRRSHEAASRSLLDVPLRLALQGVFYGCISE